MAWKTVTASLLAGGIALGTIVTWDGGAIIDDAQNMIQEQAAELNLFGQQQTALVEKITTMKAELKKLLDEGRPEDKERITELETAIAEAEAATAADAQAIQEHIELQEAEVESANADAAELGTTMDEVGETPEPMSKREIAVLTDTIPEGYTVLGMMTDTPQIVGETKLTIDDVDGELVVANDGSVNYYLVLDGESVTITNGSAVSLGLISDLDGSLLEITDAYGEPQGQYFLSAE